MAFDVILDLILIQLHQVIDGFFQSANLLLASPNGRRTVRTDTRGFLVQAEQDPIENGEIFDQGRSTVRIQYFRPTFNNKLNRNQKLSKDHRMYKSTTNRKWTLTCWFKLKILHTRIRRRAVSTLINSPEMVTSLLFFSPTTRFWSGKWILVIVSFITVLILAPVLPIMCEWVVKLTSIDILTG